MLSLSEKELEEIKIAGLNNGIVGLMGLTGCPLLVVGAAVFTPILIYICKWFKNEFQNKHFNEWEKANVVSVLTNLPTKGNDIVVIDDEWLAIYLSIIKNKCDSKSQILWAAVLNNKLLNQSSVSVSTLLKLQKFSADDIKLFASIYQYIVYPNENAQAFIPLFDIVKKYIKPEWVLYLEELGLVQTTELIAPNLKIFHDDHILFRNKNYLLIARTNGLNDYVVPVKSFYITRFGKELYDLYNLNCDERIFELYAREILKSNSQLRLEIVKDIG